MNIDRIARAMVDVEPSADLEARIRARLDEVKPRNGSATWWSWRVGVPLAATAAIALALVVRNPVPQVPSSSGPQVPSSSGPQVLSSSVPQVPSSSAPHVLSSPAPKFRSSPVPNFPTSRLSAEEIAWMERRMPALDPVIALQMDRLSADSIQPEPLAITPLTITPVGTNGTGKGAL